MTLLTKFYLELKAKATELMGDQQYEEAERVLSVIIDDEKANNPYHRYLRAKCYYNFGINYLSKARQDLAKVIRYTQKAMKQSGLVLLMKAHYVAGLLEVSFGSDQTRAIYHFEQFLSIVKLFTIRRLEADVPEIKDMQDNAIDYIQ